MALNAGHTLAVAFGKNYFLTKYTPCGLMYIYEKISTLS